MSVSAEGWGSHPGLQTVWCLSYSSITQTLVPYSAGPASGLGFLMGKIKALYRLSQLPRCLQEHQALSQDRLEQRRAGRGQSKRRQTSCPVESGTLICSPAVLGDHKYSDLPAANARLRPGTPGSPRGSVTEAQDVCTAGLGHLDPLSLRVYTGRQTHRSATKGPQANRSKSSL